MSELTTEPEAATVATESPQTRAGNFVDYVIRRCNSSCGKGLAAALRRADNPATEYQCWELLASWNIDLEKHWLRLPYATVCAGLAKAKAEHNGNLTLGAAIAASYSNEDQKASDNAAAKARLRRLLACHDTEEVCRILRPLLSLIASRQTQPLDFARLLNQLLSFHWQAERIKAQWAQEFYGHQPAVSEGGSA